MRLETTTDRRLIPSGRSSKRYVIARYTAPEAPRTVERAPISVAIVLDRSGSMGGMKLQLAREAAIRALGMLRPSDRFSLVVFDDEISLLVSGQPGTPDALGRAREMLERCDAGGATNLCGGYLEGCRALAESLEPGAAGRCLLLTDGQANRGEVRHEILAQHARELRSRGITTSTFGVGHDYDERLLALMGESGGGNYYYIARESDIPEMLTSELGEALEVVARDVHLDIEVGEGARVEPVLVEAVLTNRHGTRVRLGDLVSRQSGEVVFAVTFAPAGGGVKCPVRCTLVGPSGEPLSAARHGDWRVVRAHEADAERADRDACRAAAKALDARARQDALELNRAGQYAEAEALLRKAASGIRELLPGDPVVEGIARKLESEMTFFEVPMTACEMKARHFEARSVRLGRDVAGRATRG